MDQAQELISKFKEKQAHVAVLGLGYVGLPLAVVFAESGFKVTGIDPIKAKVEQIKASKSYILDIRDEQIKKLVDSGNLTATSDFSVLADIDAVSICVPTPLRKTGDPDLSYILAVSESLKKYVHKGMVIVLESTTYPGTTREMILPKLEESGLEVGKDFFLAFSPERVDPGRKDWTTTNTPKVLGGITPACLEVSKAWYSSALETVVPVSSAEVAEMAKLLENTFRMINIGMVNEMAIMCDRLGVDVWEVIEAAATKPFGYMKFLPGPGLGGHCIPIDPLYLSWKLKTVNYSARFIELASEINTSMPRYTVSKVQDTLNTRKKALNGSNVLVIGVAYKPDIDDLRESPALDIIHLLGQKGATVSYHDPYIQSLDHDDIKMDSVKDLDAAVKAADCVVIVTNHSAYDYKKILQDAQLIVDTRNALGLHGQVHEKVVRL
ncbi:MAG: UDP-N-acetyl-D-glucosamine dehydrogenase [Chloroflexota bacterium]|nr:UDP-N-acetyl-D-glucosamine dehydrogenase [Chloroflexota bacterium]